MRKAKTKEGYIAAFWERVEKTHSCWLWTGALHSGGYGVLRVNCSKAGQGKLLYAHRFAYELLRGSIPQGLQLDHLCRVRHCCNPAHLEPVTNRENWRRGLSKSAIHAAQTKCINGHDLSGDNLYLRPDGEGRQCLICKHAYWQKWYAAKKAKDSARAQG